MSTDQAPDQSARGGLAIVASLLLAAVLIVNLQAVADLTRDHLDLVVVLPEAPGLRVGSPVWVEGIESGRVQSIAFLPTDDSVEVAVSVRLAGETRAVLRQDSDARALRQRFIGQPLVSLEAGTPAAARLATGDTLRGGAGPDPLELLDRVRQLPGSLAAVVEQARRIGAMTEDRRSDLETLGRRVDAVVQASAALSDQLEGGSLQPLLAADALGPRVTALQERLAEVSVAVGEAMERYTGGGEEASELGVALERLSSRAGRLEADLADLSGALDGGDGLLGRMARDSALAVAVRGVQAQVDSVRAEAASIVMRMLLP